MFVIRQLTHCKQTYYVKFLVNSEENAGCPSQQSCDDSSITKHVLCVDTYICGHMHTARS